MTRRPARRPLTALAALAALLLVLPAAALPASPDGAAGAATECGGTCPLMQAQTARAMHHGGHGMAAAHRPPRGHHGSAPGCGRGASDAAIDCCAAPASQPAVPLDEAAPSPAQQVAEPAPAALPALPVPARAAVSGEHDLQVPLPPGPALYTLHSSLLN